MASSSGAPARSVPLVLGLCALLAGPAAAREFSDAVREALRQRLESPEEIHVADEIIHTRPDTAAFYEARRYAPAWTVGAGLVGRLLQAISDARLEGLEPSHYHATAIADRWRELRAMPVDAGAAVDLELLSTDAFLLLASHYLSGHLDPETIDPEWKASRRRSDLVGLLERALQDGDVEAALRSMLPPQAGYARLRDALRTYRELAAAGPWTAIPAGPALKPGSEGESVGLLRGRLQASGDLRQGSWEDADRFDEMLEEAVKRFQERHGLLPDGVVGPATREALNVPVAQRVRQIRVNLERWRWLPEDLGRRHVLVNTAGFGLQAVADGRVELDMRVIVGRSYRRTPVFSDRITYLVFNPSWEIPTKLAVQDILPQLRKDPAYLDQMGIRVLRGWGAEEEELDGSSIAWDEVPRSRFPYRLRQRPGPLNALGRVKFMFPNAYNVYLHDTPARELFARPERGLSSGCIRVEQPIELSLWLLSDADWDPARIQRVLETEQEKSVRLASPVDVHLLYWTAWVEGAPAVQFRKDVYGRDALIDAALREDPPGPER